MGPDEVAPTIGTGSGYPLAFPTAKQEIDLTNGTAKYTIPNFIDDLPIKLMRITIWQNCSCYDIAGSPTVSASDVSAAPVVAFVGVSDNFAEFPEPSEFYLTYDYKITPNPDSEIITFNFDPTEFSDKVERITFDTISTIPLPGSILLMLSALAGGGWLAANRRATA